MSKPVTNWNIQIKIDDPDTQAQLEALVSEYKLKTGNRKVGGAGVLLALLRGAILQKKAGHLIDIGMSLEKKEGDDVNPLLGGGKRKAA